MSLTREPQVRPNRSRTARWVLPVGGAALVLAGLYFVRFGRINHDEGIYLYAARLLCEGQLPYRDFAFFQAPLVLLVHAIPQCLAPGIETGRWTSFAIGALACALTLRLAFERGGATAVAVVVGGIVGAPLAAWALVFTRTEPLTALCLVVAATCLTRPEPQPHQRALAVLAAALAVATRISSAPVAVFIGLWALRGGVRSRSDALRILAPGLAVAIMVAALILSGGLPSGWFQIYEMQAERHLQFNPIATTASLWLAAKWNFVVRAGQQFGVLPVLSLLTTLGFGLLWLWRREPGSRGERLAAAGPLSLLVLLAWAPHLVPLVLYPVYVVSVLPLLLVLGGWGLAAALERWPGAGFRGRRAVLAGGLAGLALAQGHTFLERHDQWARRAPSDLEVLRNVGQELARYLPADRQLFTFDIYVAVAAGRRIPSGLEMGIFSWFPRRSASDGERLGLLTTDRLMKTLADPEVGAVALSDEALGVLALRAFTGYQPNRRLSGRQIGQAFPPLREFRLVRVVPSFGPRDAPLYLLVRKDQQ